jgi:hypothetical protein
MPTYLTPGIYLEEVPGGPRSIEAVGTSTAAFVGVAPNAEARPGEAVAVNNVTQFATLYAPSGSRSTPLAQAVFGFFANGGSRCYVVNTAGDVPLVGAGRRGALDVLAAIDEIAIVAAPGANDAATYDALLTHCETLGDRVALLDGPPLVDDMAQLTEQMALPDVRRRADPAVPPPPGDPNGAGAALAVPPAPSGGARPRGSDRGYGAVYFPWLRVRDPLDGEIKAVPPSGHVAGVWARNDAMRGVHKAPANETVRGALDVTQRLTDAEHGVLNQAGVNAIRFFTSGGGIRIWGARTLAVDPEWRYLNVRRLLNMIEESVLQGTNWVVFEPNDQLLWRQVRRDIGAFLTRMWRDGALLGRSPEEAFFVKCDEETNPPEVVDAGQLVVAIGVAPVKPAEFIILRISQFQGGSESEIQGVPNA